MRAGRGQGRETVVAAGQLWQVVGQPSSEEEPRPSGVKLLYLVVAFWIELLEKRLNLSYIISKIGLQSQT